MGKSGNHAIFAANLRRLCETQTSIADVCRDTGINRQQFNKYLAGRAIPSAPILRKICERLGVSEDALLAPAPRAEGMHGTMAAASRRIGQFGRELERLFKLFIPEFDTLKAIKSQELKPGRYYIYFPFGDEKDFLLRTYVEVWWHKDLLLFTRLSRIDSPRRTGLPMRARHYGVVLASKGEFSLVARNNRPPYQMSQINFGPELFFNRFYLGIALSHFMKPIAYRVVMERVDGKTPRRELLRHCGLVRFEDKSVPDFVQRALDRGAPRGPTLQVPDLDKMITSTMIGDK